MQNAPCAVSDSGVSTCYFSENYGYSGKLQNLRINAKLQSQEDIIAEMKWPIASSSHELKLYWRFEPEFVVTSVSAPSEVSSYVLDLSGEASSLMGTQSNTLSKNSGFFGGGIGAALIDGSGDTPQLQGSQYPCGEVYSNTWYFKAPAKYTDSMNEYIVN